MGMQKKKTLASIGKAIILLLFLVWTVFPLYWMVITSFKPRMEISQMDISLWPQTFTIENYVTAFKSTHFGVFMLNSTIVTLISSTVVLVISIMGGYALSRYRFKGQNAVLLVFIASQMIPLVVAIIPMFILYSKIGLVDNLLSLIISYTVANIPFCLITMSSFFRRIPVSLEEAAMIDGCTRFQAVVRVILPTMLPSIVAVFVFAFTGCWNELFYSIMMISKESLRTIPAGLMNFVQKFNVDWGQMTAAASVTMIPVAVLFFFAQKHIVAGMTAGAVKE